MSCRTRRWTSKPWTARIVSVRSVASPCREGGRVRRSYRLITLGTIDMQLLKVAEEKRRLERIVTHHERKVEIGRRSDR